MTDESTEELQQKIKELEDERKRLELESQALKLKQEVDDKKDKLHPSPFKRLFKKVFS